jgi:hypothetical protein
VALELDVATSDTDIIDFVEGQFEKVNYSALSIVNIWIENRLVSWHSDLNAVIEEWDRENEPVQPPVDIEKFKRLVGHDSLGP